MPKPRVSAQTSPGDSGGASLTRTDWSMIVQARGENGDAADEAMNRLMRRYWPAVYAYVRRSGRDVHDAADLTQGFVCDVMIGRGILQDADPAKGRFRALLLRALKNYLHERYRYQNRQRRSPAGGRILQIDPDDLERAAPAETLSADAAFSRQWGVALVDGVLQQVRDECSREGLDTHWLVFERRVARPMLFGETPCTYPELVRQLDLESVPQAANMMITVKRRFARALQREVARTVDEPWLVQEELLALRRDLEQVS